MMTLIPFIVIAVIAVLFVYGYYAMNKLDIFLTENKSEQPKNLLRVAVEYTGLESAIKDELEKLESQYPDFRMLLYGGRKQHILSLLQRDEADIALLSGINSCPTFRFVVRECPIEQHSESENPSPASSDSTLEVTIVWNPSGRSEMLKAFTALLSDK